MLRRKCHYVIQVTGMKAEFDVGKAALTKSDFD
jgi:hypothetical protein